MLTFNLREPGARVGSGRLHHCQRAGDHSKNVSSAFPRDDGCQAPLPAGRGGVVDFSNAVSDVGNHVKDATAITHRLKLVTPASISAKSSILHMG